MSSSRQVKETSVRFFYCRFQSFQSQFGSLFSLVSIAVWIYFNRLQNPEVQELNRFVWFEKHVIERTSKTNIRMFRLCIPYASNTLPFIAVSDCVIRCLNHSFRSSPSLFESISTITTETLELNHFVFDKHVIGLTSRTNIRIFVRICTL